MNFLVSNILIAISNFNYKNDFIIDEKNHYEWEQTSFWILIYIIKEKGWKNMFVDQTPKLIELNLKFENLMKEEIPEIYLHMENLGLSVEMCFSGYFLTIMSHYAPFELTIRILDIFLLFDENVLLNILIKMLRICKRQFLIIKEMDTGFQFLRSNLLTLVFNKYRKEFQRNIIRI